MIEIFIINFKNPYLNWMQADSTLYRILDSMGGEWQYFCDDDGCVFIRTSPYCFSKPIISVFAWYVVESYLPSALLGMDLFTLRP